MAAIPTPATDVGEATLEERVDAASSLVAGTPTAAAEELLDDRRLALRWWSILFPVGFVLFSWLTLGLAAQNSDGASAPGAARAVVAFGLVAALVGGVNRWRIERHRLQQRRPEMVFTRKQCIVLLGRVASDGDVATAGAPLPVLVEIVRWRLAAGPTDHLLMGGASLSWIWANVHGAELRPWLVVLGAIAVVLLVVVAALELRSRRRYRRFLARWGVGSARPVAA